MRDSAVIRIVGDQLCWYPPGRGDEPRDLSHAEQQAQLLDILQARRSPVIFAVPGTAVRLQEVSYSANEKRHIARSLPYLLEEEYASDIEALHIASTPLAPETLAVAGSEHQSLQHWQQLLADYPGIQQWVPEPLLLPWRQGEITLVIESGLAVMRQGPCVGLSIETSLLPAVLADSDITQTNTVVMYGYDQDADMALLPEAWREKVQWRNGGFSAALLLTAEERAPLNLLQGEYGPKLPLERWWTLWRWPMAALAAAFAVQMVLTFADYKSLQGDNLRLRQALEASYREAVPKGAIADPERQLSRKLRDLRGGDASVPFMAMLESVGQVIQAQPGARISNINFSGRTGDLRLNLVVPDFRAVEKIREQINSGNYSASVESSNAQGEEVRARMKVTARTTGGAA